MSAVNLIAKLVSSPAWGRGLKCPPVGRGRNGGVVVPRVGTWVEIGYVRQALTLSTVVPRVGTWVEI